MMNDDILVFSCVWHMTGFSWRPEIMCDIYITVYKFVFYDWALDCLKLASE